MTNVLYSIDGGGFQHATVDTDPGDLDHAERLVAEQLAARGERTDGLRIHRITPL